MSSAPKVQKRPKTLSAKAVTGKTRKRKPPFDRAIRSVELIEKRITLLLTNVRRWEADAVGNDQVAQTIAQVRALHSAAGVLAETIDELREQGYTPTVAGKGGRTPLSVDNPVALKPHRYDPVLHGVNEYKVTRIGEKLYEIASSTTTLTVPRNWLLRRESVDEVPVENGD